MVDWQEEYKKKLVSAEEAISIIKSEQRVAFAYGAEPQALGLALCSRLGDLQNVRLVVPAPGRDFGWYDPGWEMSFQIEVGFILPMVRNMIEERRGDYIISGLVWAQPPGVRPNPDVLLMQLSTPDDHGFCGFGNSLWDKKEAVREAKMVIAEANPRLIRTYGDNFIHMSEIDYFVEHIPTGKTPGATDILGRKSTGPGEVEKTIAESIASIINDGDCLEIGVGGAAEWLPLIGVLDNKHDLGWHSENTPRGIATLMRNGVINSKRKQIKAGIHVATAVGGGTREEMDWIANNPLIEVHSSFWVLNPAVICQNDNVVAINSCLSIDLTGQIASESLGPTMLSGTGGQLTFAIGAALSKGGRNITCCRSTAKTKAGTISRIVPQLPVGTIVTVPRVLADMVITEYGIARLRGKTQRERVEELIAIAHPDFRAELRKEAQRLYWP